MEETTAAIKAAKEAGKLLVENFKNIHTIQMKDSREIVTETDKASEQIILDILKKEYPNYAYLSEEAGKSPRDCEYMWVIDPLDGTTNYSIKNPFFDVSIALAGKTFKGWEIISGVVFSPFTRELFFAEKGEGAFLNGERISVSKEREIKNLLLAYCGGSSDHHILRTVNLFAKIKPVCRDFNRMRAGALELAYVADGRLGGYISAGGKPWDAAAGSLLVLEAGGSVTDFGRMPWSIEGEEKDILATNGLIHDMLLEVVKNV